MKPTLYEWPQLKSHCRTNREPGVADCAEWNKRAFLLAGDRTACIGQPNQKLLHA
ncbi:hypothetical protein [Paenibacillus polymyxa]|uniref:hypothetical protein n=1 Tax=Paenibacillus polymyxa TaxID=1406 RepID=UPI0018AD53F7|nr:hypothetical protein [Paenibacillus polymyxa]